MTEFTVLFLGSFAWVFIQGFQSRCVNSGDYRLAFCMSFALGLSQAFVLASILREGATLAHTMTYCTGGAFGIISAMRVHAYLKERAGPWNFRDCLLTALRLRAASCVQLSLPFPASVPPIIGRPHGSFD